MKKISFLLFFTLPFLLCAQTPGNVAQSFGSFLGFNNSISAIAAQSDGKTLLGGNFVTYNGSTVNRIIRLNTDGTRDTNFATGTGFGSSVTKIVIQTDGKILLGGYFTTYKGVAENYIIRLNADGTKDTTFNVGSGFNLYVSTIAIQTDGKILVGGAFTTYNGSDKKRIIRLNTDGTEDTTFNTGTGFNNLVNTIVTQTDGKILVGGSFTTYNGSTENCIIRLNTDGTKDTTFSSGSGFGSGSAARAIVVQTDSKIVVGGFFTTYNGSTENRIIRLNTDGTKDTSFLAGTGFNNPVNTMTAQADGKILVVGGFGTYKGSTENCIIRLNTDGAKDSTFDTGTGIGGGEPSTIAVQADGKILVGGTFASYKGLAENYIIRLNTDGTKNNFSITGTGFNASVSDITTQADGKILLGGSFTSYKGGVESSITCLNTDGTKDTSFNTGSGFNGGVNKIVPQTDGKILVGGSFAGYKGLAERYIIRLNTDGTKDATFITGVGFNGAVYTIAIQTDGKILVGGNFTTYKGLTEKYIIRLNTDGTKDTSFSTEAGFNTSVNTIVTQADGKILVGGAFTTYKGLTENYIIRLNTDGTEDTTFNAGTGFNGSVATIATQADGKILVGGAFTTYNGSTENRIIRLNADGTEDTTFNTGTGLNGGVSTIAIQADGKILLGGGFTSYKGTIEKLIICLNTDGTKNTSFTTGTGFNSSVSKIAIQNNGQLLAGGAFTTYKDDNGSTFVIGLYPSTDSSLGTPSFTNSNSFTVYPNPVQDTVYIQSKNGGVLKAVQIYDLQGRLVLEDTKDVINLDRLSKGVYVAKIISEKGEITKKIIKE